MSDRRSRLDDVTLVIPTLGRPVLRDCIQSVLDGDAWPARLIVVDQGDNGEVTGWLADASTSGLEITHIQSRRRGTAAATNDGIDSTASRFLAVTHDDCRVARDWLVRLRERLDESPAAIITGRVNPEEGAPGYTPSIMTSDEEAVYSRPLLDRDPLFPANMAFSMETARRNGRFNEDSRMKFAEDAEWSYRALKGGIPIIYAPEAIVEHRDWRTAEQISLTYKRYASSQGGFYGIYLREGDPFIALRAAFDILRGPWIWAKGRITGNTELVVIGKAYMVALLPGIFAGLGKTGMAKDP
jgi:GT2 family glycosyltransferase